MSVIKVTNIIWAGMENNKDLPTDFYVEINSQEEKKYLLDEQQHHFDLQSDWFVAIQAFAEASIEHCSHGLISSAFSRPVVLGFRMRPPKTSPNAVVYSGPLWE